MTLVPNVAGGAGGAHVGELRLRRFRLGELAAPEHEDVARHTTACGTCRARLDGLADEQRAFEQEIPFPRFAGGVERAHRLPGAARPAVEWPQRRRRPLVAWVTSFGVAAAAALVLLVAVPLVRQQDGGMSGRGTNNIKSGDRLAEARIADADGREQRAAAAVGIVALRPGERLRLGYRSDAPAFVAAFSIDDAGAVTALYPERGPALPVATSRDLTYFPDAILLTGGGRERVYVVLLDRPLPVERLAAGAKTAYDRARGDLAAMRPAPDLAPTEGVLEAFSWLFAKP
jgi:hypothetical protein